MFRVKFVICLCLFLHVSCMLTTVKRDTSEEYLGCVLDDGDQKLFTFSPGEYLPSEVSPIGCILACGQRWHVAGILNGSICLCSPIQPRFYSLEPTTCLRKCTGLDGYPKDKLPMCGGSRNYISVYNISRITGLKFEEDEKYKVLDFTRIKVSIFNGKNVNYTFDTDDGRMLRSDSSSIQHIFSGPGEFKVTVTAENDISGPQSVSKVIRVRDTEIKGTLSCALGQEFGKIVECYGSILRGSGIVLRFEFGDGSEETMESRNTFNIIGNRITGHEVFENIQRKGRFTVIIPNAEFQKDTVVYGWEFQALTLGKIILQIYMPICAENELFCQTKHACSSSSEKCNRYGEHKCAEDEVYCFWAERCLKVETSYSSCSLYQEYNFLEQPADYKLAYEKEYEIEYIGHHFVQEDTVLHVKTRSVIGWASEGGEISYSNVSDKDASEFLFSTDSISADKIFFRRAKLPESLLKRHSIAAHSVDESMYYLSHNYTRPGSYDISSNLFTKSVNVRVDIPIDNIEISCPDKIFTFTQKAISIILRKGSGVSYKFNMGDGRKDVIVKNNKFLFQYDNPGVYNINVTGFNTISEKSNQCITRVYHDISGLTFKEKLKPVPVGVKTRIKWGIDLGTNVSYTIHFGDSKSDNLTLDSLSGEVEHMYATHGEFNVTVIATNELGSEKKIHSKAIVDVPIGSVKIYTEHKFIKDYIFVPLDTLVMFKVSVTNGTNVICKFYFKDDGDYYTTKLNFASTKYQVEGTYSVSVTCYNSISTGRSRLNQKIIVQRLEKITNLKVNVEGGTKFGENAIVSGSMKTGTVYICLWDFGDGFTFKTDPSTFPKSNHYRYKNVGPYKISVHCQNDISELKASFQLTVDIPISGLGIVCPSTLSFKVGEKVQFYAVVQNGTNINSEIHFGDGQVAYLEMKSKIPNGTNHTYTKPGKYVVTVYAKNQLMGLNSTCDDVLNVQIPVDGVEITTADTIRFNPGVAVFYYTLRDKKVPTDAKITFNFGDVENKRLTVILDEIVNSGSKVLHQHKYISPDIYKASVMVFNNVSSKEFTFSIDVMKLKDLVLTILEKTSKNAMIPGKGDNNVYFSDQTQTYVNITKQRKDLSYHINFGDGYHMEDKTENSAVYTYKKPGKYLINATVIHVLGVFTKEKVIYIQAPIQRINMKTPSGIELKQTLNVILEIKENATDLCVIVHFGDNTTHVTNINNCIQSKFTGILEKEELIPLPNLLVIKHKFSIMNTYNITTIVYNQVSRLEETKKLIVEYKPCPDIIVKIHGGGDKDLPLESMRASSITIRAVFEKLVCEFAENVTFTWKLSMDGRSVRLPDANADSEVRRTAYPLKIKDGDPNPAVFIIPSDFLPFGRVRIGLTLGYESTRQDLSIIQAKTSTWLKITPSSLRAVIQGGVGRAVGFEMPVIFDASKTVDPDADVIKEFIPSDVNATIKYRWFCKRIEEEFNEDYRLKHPENRDAGCFRNGRFQLDASYGGFEKLNDEGSIIRINTTMAQHARFTMRIYVTKGQRTGLFDQVFKVLPGEPPVLTISCLLNCFDKLNPEEPLKIQSLCTNCNSVTKVYYRWRLYHKVKGHKNMNLPGVEVGDLESKTSTSVTNKNIALKSNVLESGNEYVMRLNAWKDGANESTAGFRDFMFIVNEKPRDGICVLNPRVGVALQDKFTVKCADWIDTDSPITYKIDSIRDGVTQNLYAGESRENSMYLPLGNPEEDYSYNVVVTVNDKFFFGERIQFAVKVLEPGAVDYSKVNNNLKSMVGGNIQELARYALAAGSVLNNKAQSRKKRSLDSYQGREDSKDGEARNKMLEAVSKVAACSLSEIKQLGGVQMELTKTGISEDAEEESGNALATMSECMSNSPASDPDMETTANTMLMASSNILKSGLSRQKNVTNTTGKSQTDKVIDTLNNIGGAVMRQMVAGDEKKKMNVADSVNVEMSQVAEESEEESVGFKIPNLDHLFGNQSDGSRTEDRQASVGAMMTDMAKNPYGGASGSEDIDSNVMGLALSGPNGRPLDLTGQVISMFVKREMKQEDVKAPTYTFTENRLRMTFHRFNITSDDKVMVIEMKPLHPHINSSIYIREKVKPSLKNVNKTYHYQQPPRGKITDKVKLPDPHIRVLKPSDLNGTGEYYIGISLYPSVMGSEEEQHNTGRTWMYSLRMWETKCKLWDDELNTYTSENCEVGPKTTFVSTQCSCVIGGNVKDEEFDNEFYDDDDDGYEDDDEESKLVASPNSAATSTNTTLTTTMKTTTSSSTTNNDLTASTNSTITINNNLIAPTSDSNLTTSTRKQATANSNSNITHITTNVNNTIINESITTTTITTTEEVKTTTKNKKTRAKHPIRKRKKRRKITRATFAGGFIVAPNPIDFSAAFAGFGNLSENYLAFTVVLVVLGVYLMLLVWARREDRKDISRAGVTALEENDPADRHFYEITVYTGFSTNGGTTANVYIQLSGDQGQTEARQLKDPNRKLFQKRQEDIFLASFEEDIGDLQHVRIWHDNSGKSPSWNLSRIMVHDLNMDRKFLFLNGDVIAVETGDGSLERVLSVAGPEDMKSFSILFYSTSQKNFTDKHIWFSIFIRPAKSRFTRVQRLSCCLTILYMTMLSSMMFYEVGGAQSDVTYHLGPFSFSPSQIGIGVMTTLIIFPVNLLIVGVFRSIGPKPSSEELAKKRSKKNWLWLEFRELLVCCPRKEKTNKFIDILSEPDDGRSSRLSVMTNNNNISDVSAEGKEIGIKLETEEQEKERKEKEKKLKNKKKKLPYWMKYFAWGLMILTSFTGAFFVVLYGNTFGKEKSEQWFSTFFLSFVQDVFVAQPMKVLGLALFIAAVVKKPNADEEDLDEAKETNKIKTDEEYLQSVPQMKESPKKGDIIRFKPPSKERVNAMRNYRLKEIKMYNILRELFIYIMFVVALCQVSYSQMDPQSFRLRKSLWNVFVETENSNFHESQVHVAVGTKSDVILDLHLNNEMHSMSDVWSWLKGTVFEGLFYDKMYNDQPVKLGFTSDMYSNVFGGARIRQLRVKEHTCIVHRWFKKRIHKCNDGYSWGEEDTDDYDIAWKPLLNDSLSGDFDEAWRFHTSKELSTYPFVGRIAAYGGGGYVGHFLKKEESKDLLEHLYKNKWLDSRSRALFVEVTTYNAQVNLFTVINLIVEFLPTGGIETFSSIRIARLYTYGGSTAGFTIACQLFVLLFIFIFLYKEGKKIYRQKRAYFSGFWNLLEFSLVVLIISTLVIFFGRMGMVKQAIKQIHENPGKYVSFNKIVQVDTMFSALSSIVVFLSCIKSLKLLQYNHTISVLASTLQGSAKPLAGFSVIFFVFFFAFSTGAYILFMPYNEKFSSFVTTLESVMGLLLGDFDYRAIETSKPIFGRIWFFLIILFGSMYIMNVFLAIVMDTYSEVNSDIMLQSQEYQIVDFMVNKFKCIIGKGDDGQKALLQEITEKEKQMQMAEGKQQRKKETKKHPDLKPSNLSPNRINHNNYFNVLDDEINKKFAELDDSLNDYWLNLCDGESHSTNPPMHNYNLFTAEESLFEVDTASQSSPRKKFFTSQLSKNTKKRSKGTHDPFIELQEEQIEILMMKDLQEELEKWM